ncbi:MAG TPA: hypothetical protein VFI15_12155 [Candidatus Limnocylindrales bacterium]|nr:hypothetical protein [Candidatus Limnocylindrales bacterium]
MDMQEFEAGPDHLLVLYVPGDVGTEVDPVAIFSGIAADATARADSGLRMLSMTTMPLRHAGTAFGQEGSGYETSTSVAVLYERWAGVKA